MIDKAKRETARLTLAGAGAGAAAGVAGLAMEARRVESGATTATGAGAGVLGFAGVAAFLVAVFGGGGGVWGYGEKR
jgi:hypothetical protein